LDLRLKEKATIVPSERERAVFGARYILRVVLGLTLVVLTLELLVRFLVMGPGILFVPDSNIGKVPIKGTNVLWGTEGYGHTQYVRDGEIATLSMGGPVVVVLGDSHTEAYQVDDASKFVSVAETDLLAQGKRFDLHNLGFSGGTMADYVQLGPSITARYHPIAVVIQLTAADFGEESFDMTRVNYFVRASNGLLKLIHRDASVGSPSLGARVKHVSALINYLHMRYLTIAERKAGGTNTNRNGNTAATVEINRDAITAQLDMLQRAYAGTRVILLILPTVPRIQSGGISTMDPAHEQLLQIIRNLPSGAVGWQIVDPLPAFRQLPGHSELPRGFLNTRPGSGHLNVSGHRIVGKLLAEAIESVRP
jgi:hypothetical protein